ncbi:hypothetical protein A3K82_02395 [Candidatus Pacearchaeota archaeon RBG_19FT_COMBO_34_9]|nr:MAG: hypothetical protein A3K82_02395 [Candidatus Pacearchaeota archaeon RBG_19FT_COMBO_34_9]OGJ16491.1 MAG: hypothetical protein A3K74_00055 [Candidatus Pacearchaeota archaeon RBG_13_33_26]
MKDKNQVYAKKAEHSILYRFEQKFRRFIIPKIPNFIETYHLTYLTLVFSILLLISGFLINDDVLLLLIISLIVLLQWIFDVLDGGLGRYRNTGLVRWGFFADHFLDFVFMASVLLAYHSFLNGPADYNYLFLLIIAFSSVGLMINCYLYFGATQLFFTSTNKIGTSEARLALILFNIILIFTGKMLIIKILPYLAIGSVLVLIYSFLKNSKRLWRLDMRLKHKDKSQRVF